MVWNRLTQVRIMWYDDVCTMSHTREPMTPFCREVASVFVCGKAGPWWRYRGPSTEEIRLRHPSDACPPAATRERQNLSTQITEFPWGVSILPPFSLQSWTFADHQYPPSWQSCHEAAQWRKTRVERLTFITRRPSYHLVSWPWGMAQYLVLEGNRRSLHVV